VKLAVVAIGRARERELRALLDDYAARIRRYAQFDEVEIRDERDGAKLDGAVQRAAVSMGPRVELIALDAGGRSLTSEGFARRMGALLDRAAAPVFVIGGADGLPHALRERAVWTLSLGAMTLPHRLARIVLYEQIYRAFTILRGEPYAREGPRD
jgi:23S rRNA (pseudouridine1915-N3)-methyltransferase